MHVANHVMIISFYYFMLFGDNVNQLLLSSRVFIDNFIDWVLLSLTACFINPSVTYNKNWCFIVSGALI